MIKNWGTVSGIVYPFIKNVAQLASISSQVGTDVVKSITCSPYFKGYFSVSFTFVIFQFFFSGVDNYERMLTLVSFLCFSLFTCEGDCELGKYPQYFNFCD